MPLYLGLFSDVPPDGEITDSPRQPFVFDGKSQNQSEIVFSPGAAYEAAEYGALFDAPVGGKLWKWGPLSPRAQNILPDNQIRFPPGHITVFPDVAHWTVDRAEKDNRSRLHLVLPYPSVKQDEIWFYG
ncbi:MAG: hypothetical protein GY862_02950 [Gammaproteobacteria bacterium]|nr:hypothetical protein [Gammaproteobacteria bacterium]